MTDCGTSPQARIFRAIHARSGVEKASDLKPAFQAVLESRTVPYSPELWPASTDELRHSRVEMDNLSILAKYSITIPTRHRK